MPAKSLHNQKWFASMAAVVGWIAVAGQLYLILENRTSSVVDTIIRFFSFFTILTNLLTAVCFSNIAFTRAGRAAFLSKPATIFGITVNMLIVGITYNVILRFTWDPQGLQRIADELLHVVMPLVMFAYWWLYVKGMAVKNSAVFAWLLYPLFYLLYILIRGANTGLYPYPFIDVIKLGYTKVAVNAGVIMAVFFVITFLLLWISKMATRPISS